MLQENISLFYYTCIALSIALAIVLFIVGRIYLLKSRKFSSKKISSLLVNIVFLVVVIVIVVGVVYFFRVQMGYKGLHAIEMMRLTEMILVTWLSSIFLALSLTAYFALKKKYLQFSKICLKFGLIYGVILLVLQLIFIINSIDEISNIKDRIKEVERETLKAELDSDSLDRIL